MIKGETLSTQKQEKAGPEILRHETRARAEPKVKAPGQQGGELSLEGGEQEAMPRKHL